MYKGYKIYMNLLKKIPLGIWIWAGTIETFITSVTKTVSDTIEENNLDSTEDVTRFYQMEPIQMRSINHSKSIRPVSSYATLGGGGPICTALRHAIHLAYTARRSKCTN